MDTSEATVKLIGAALSGDRAAGEKAERDLDVLIAKRDKARRQTEAERGREELWAESVRRHNAKLEAEESRSRLAWAKHLRRVYAARMDEKDRLIETLEGTEPKGA